jgi:hypothetical protein
MAMRDYPIHVTFLISREIVNRLRDICRDDEEDINAVVEDILAEYIERGDILEEEEENGIEILD